jgi:hypothetical protein
MDHKWNWEDYSIPLLLEQVVRINHTIALTNNVVMDMLLEEFENKEK